MNGAAMAMALIGIAERVLLLDPKTEITPAELIEINQALAKISLRMSELLARIAAQHVDVLPDPTTGAG